MKWNKLKNIIKTVMCRPVIIRDQEKTATQQDVIVLDLHTIRKEAKEKTEKEILREITVFNMLYPYHNEIYDESYDRIITSILANSFREYFKEYFK